jgi:hypothetical protein
VKKALPIRGLVAASVIARAVGYRVAFLTLGGFALGSLASWPAFSTLLKQACAVQPGEDDGLPGATTAGGTRVP